MKYLVTSAGVFIALAFMALSAAINWRYGHSIGRDEADQLIYAAVSLAGDLAKATTPFFFWFAARNRRVIPAIASSLFWLACTAYSLSSAAGFAELNRAEQTGRLTAKKEIYSGLHDELARKEAQLKALGAYDAPAIIEPQLDAMRQNSRWTSSKQCTDATARESRTFCADYQMLEAQRQKGIEAARLEAGIAELRGRIPELAGAARIDHGDPRAGFLVRLTGWDVLNIQTGFSLLFIAVLEIGSGLGLFIALNHGEIARSVKTRASRTSPSVPAGHDPAKLEERAKAGSTAAPAPPVGAAMPNDAPGYAVAAEQETSAQANVTFGDVAKFARARLVGAEGDSVAFDDLFAAYAAWCGGQRLKALPRPDFSRRFLLLCGAAGLRHAKRGRKHVCLDLKIARADEKCHRARL